MALVGKIKKHAYEELNYAFTFTGRLGSSDSISSASVTAVRLRDGASATATVIDADPAPVVAGQDVNFRLIGGQSGARYLVSCKIATGDGEHLQDDLEVWVDG